ncbi:hypothetical protein SZ28_01120 [Burkholderia pseudomallei]|nr:hypothetical protein SZ28_01120 [Burkholderia pseudomallei]
MSRAAFACRPADANRAPNAPSAAHACRHARAARPMPHVRATRGECPANVAPVALSHLRVRTFVVLKEILSTTSFPI